MVSAWIRSVWTLVAMAALLSGTTTNAKAWGDEGHQIIALIAYQHLTPQVRNRVDGILRHDHDRLTEPDIASRATWADRYRDSDRASSRERYTLTREWHFVDIELDDPDLKQACFGHPSPAKPASAGPEKACVVDRIDAFAAELKSLPVSDPERTIAFRFLLHLVGDVHQPLHAADNHDRGGNDVLVLFGRHRVGRPLHAYWDVDVVVDKEQDVAALATSLNSRFGSRCQGWMRGKPRDWAMESFTIAKTVVYALDPPVQDSNDKPAHPLSDAYQAKARAVAAEQLAKAGCRLAMVLNQALR